MGVRLQIDGCLSTTLSVSWNSRSKNNVIRKKCFHLLYFFIKTSKIQIILKMVFHFCVGIFFWSSGIMDCMLFTFQNMSSAHALSGVSGVASFITTYEQPASIKPRLLFFHAGYAMLPAGFPLSQFNWNIMHYFKILDHCRLRKRFSTVGLINMSFNYVLWSELRADRCLGY